MSLTTIAQQLVVQPPIEEEMVVIVPSSDFEGNQQELLNVNELELPAMIEDNEKNLEICDKDEPLEIEIKLEGDLPGALFSPELEVEEKEDEKLEVSEDSKKEDSNKADENDAKKSKKNEKWDWESKGAEGFLIWIKERFDSVPKHSGYDSSGLQRAISYLDKLDNEISKAMRADVDGELDADKVEEIREKIEDGLDKLYDRLDKVTSSKKRKKKASSSHSEGFIKEAQKIAGIRGTFVTVPLLISGIGRIIINGTVSAGHDVADMFKKLSKKYKLDDREKFELTMFLFDAGYPLHWDRGFMPDEEVDVTSSDNFDWAANYQS